MEFIKMYIEAVIEWEQIFDWYAQFFEQDDHLYFEELGRKVDKNGWRVWCTVVIPV